MEPLCSSSCLRMIVICCVFCQRLRFVTADFASQCSVPRASQAVRVGLLGQAPCCSSEVGAWKAEQPQAPTEVLGWSRAFSPRHRGVPKPHQNCTACSPLILPSAPMLYPFSFADIPFLAERTPKPGLSKALAKGSVSTKQPFLKTKQNKTKLFCPNPKCLPTTGVDLLSSFVPPTAAQVFLSRCASPIFLFSLLQHTCLQPAVCSSKHGRESEQFYSAAEKFFCFCACIFHAPHSHSCLLQRGSKRSRGDRRR